MKHFILIIVFAGLATLGGHAQTKESILLEAEPQQVFENKFYWGLSWNQYWGKIKGTDLPEEYFSKPCIGFNVRAEYYILPFLGIGAGFGVQQRGTGIINPDNYGGAFTHPWEQPMYDADSTYRERLRFKTLELPVTVLLRVPITKGVRLSGAAGVVFMKVRGATDYFLSVEDGYHLITDKTADYLKSDIGYQLSIGPDINAGESCVLQAHFVYTSGTKNVFDNGAGTGTQQTFGFRVACLFWSRNQKNDK
jgi:hypothetical protein